VIEEGSYGCVSKGICKNSGRQVALKMLVNQTKTTYNALRVLREIQIMLRLNELSRSYGASAHEGMFVPQLIEIITPKENPAYALHPKN